MDQASGRAELENEIVELFGHLSDLHGRVVRLTDKLKANGFGRSSDEAFEIVVLLKNALRILGDAMSHLP
jgi:hypothetical protein